ncbi:MAG: PatA/PatG family cyanobactin maturation protease [Symploca sp. SIO2B6]|nr:PatA/PatG family cyanobactin maturation protease [Symploca sp. SIO2B6]
MVPGIADQGPASRHGTHIASVIFGQHGGSITGIAPGCRGLIVPVFSDNGGDSIIAAQQVDLARAITQAVEAGANVINISGGQLTSSGEASQWLLNAVQYCFDNNVLIVAAAGNDGCQCLHIPAAMPTVLAVGAMNAQGLPFDFSNWGDAYQTQGILAPGENILGAVPGGGIARKSGTSFAAPIVSGLVALLLSIQLKQGDKPDPMAVRDAILNSVLPCNPQLVTNHRRCLVGSLNITGAQALITKKQGEESPVSNERLELEKIQANEEINPSEEVTNQLSEIEIAQPTILSNSVQADIVTQEAAFGIEAAVPLTAVTASSANGDCDCNNNSNSKQKPKAQLVYATGQLGYDFISEARRDSIVQEAIGVFGGSWNPNDPNQVLDNFERQPWEASGVQWILSQETTPIYAIMPSGPYAYKAYELLREFLRGQLNGEVERVSIPGFIVGETKLLSGQSVQVIIPSIRGMYSWRTDALIQAVAGARPTEAAAQNTYDQSIEGIRNFLERIYYELRNLGTTPQERALNYAATNAFQAQRIYERATNENMELDTINVEKSPLCRPESDCWDVKLTFFNPSQRYNQARKVYRFTVDVSDMVPVTVGSVRSWSVY